MFVNAIQKQFIEYYAATIIQKKKKKYVLNKNN